MLDAMAALKLNTLHWHIVDAPSFPFGSEALPNLPAMGSFHPSATYSLDDGRALVEAARLRGIRVAHLEKTSRSLSIYYMCCPRRKNE